MEKKTLMDLFVDPKQEQDEDQRLNFLTVNEDGSTEVRKSGLTRQDLEQAPEIEDPELLEVIQQARRNRGLE